MAAKPITMQLLSAARRWLALAVIAVTATAVAADTGFAIIDDSGTEVILESPATRIVSLAPHITELLYALDAGERVIATVDHSDFPAAAARLPRVGSAHKLDLERIVALQPDLIVAWRSGNPAAEVERLRTLGLSVYITEPRSLDDIAASLQDLGAMIGAKNRGDSLAESFRTQARHTIAQYAGRAPVNVFYQIWDEPLMTLNGDHIISELLRRCGGVNVFADLPTLAPQVGTEAVLAADPDVILVSGSARSGPEWVDHWRAWPRLKAVQNDHIYFIPPDLVQRQTPRILQGMESICAALDRAR